MRHTLDNKQQHMHTSDSHDGALELCYNCLHCSHDLTFGVANLSAFSLYTFSDCDLRRAILGATKFFRLIVDARALTPYSGAIEKGYSLLGFRL